MGARRAQQRPPDSASDDLSRGLESARRAGCRTSGFVTGKLVASAAVLLALSSTQELVLGLAAAAFVVFALVSAMAIPRSRPDYPGRHLGWFITVAALFTIGMLAAVMFVARETGEEEAAATGTHTTPTLPTVPTTTEGPAPAVPKGNAAAGKQLFTSQGCSSCHTFTRAGSTGQVGPNLDNLAADAQKANAGSVEEYAFVSIEHPTAAGHADREEYWTGNFGKNGAIAGYGPEDQCLVRGGPCVSRCGRIRAPKDRG